MGLPEPTLGGRVCAVVVARPGRDVQLDELREFAAAHLAAFKCPEALVVVDELPKTAAEEIAKNVIRDQLAESAVEIERMW